MSEQGWWQRVMAAINHEYDRRIRRSSLITEYGANHHGHTDHAEHAEHEASVIVNVPKGTRLGQHSPPE